MSPSHPLSAHYLYRIRGLTAEYSRSAIRLAKTTPRTTAFASSNKRLGGFGKPVAPGVQDFARPHRRECDKA